MNFICKYKHVFFMSLSIAKMFDANVGLVRLDRHPRVFVRLTNAEEADTMPTTIEGKMTHLTHDVPTLQIKRILIG